MKLFKQASPTTWAALSYITVGALVMVWTIVWYTYLRNHASEGAGYLYLCAGLLATGLTLFVIGLRIGRIGQAARGADEVAEATTPATTTAPVAMAPPAAPVVLAAPQPGPVVYPNAPSPR